MLSAFPFAQYTSHPGAGTHLDRWVGPFWFLVEFAPPAHSDPRPGVRPPGRCAPPHFPVRSLLHDGIRLLLQPSVVAVDKNRLGPNVPARTLDRSPLLFESSPQRAAAAWRALA